MYFFSVVLGSLQKLKFYWVTRSCFFALCNNFFIFCYSLFLIFRKIFVAFTLILTLLFFFFFKKFLYRSRPYFRFLIFHHQISFGTFHVPPFKTFLCFSNNIQLTFLYISQCVDISIYQFLDIINQNY